jgi:signal transduction histidine kinase
MNLVGNALKYTQDGWVKIELKTGHDIQSSRPSHLILSVSDSGIGISTDL